MKMRHTYLISNSFRINGQDGKMFGHIVLPGKGVNSHAGHFDNQLLGVLHLAPPSSSLGVKNMAFHIMSVHQDKICHSILLTNQQVDQPYSLPAFVVWVSVPGQQNSLFFSSFFLILEGEGGLCIDW